MAMRASLTGWMILTAVLALSAGADGECRAAQGLLNLQRGAD